MRRTDVLSRSLAIVSVLALTLLLVPGHARAAPPDNDDFANATEVTLPLPFTDAVDTSEATVEPGEPTPEAGVFDCWEPIAQTVWYSFTPVADTAVSVDTIGSDFFTAIGVWAGSDLGSLDLVACSEEARVVFFAEAGQEYRIQVGSTFYLESGNLSFRVRETAQVAHIRGTVTDEDTSEPLGGICVVAIDTEFDLIVVGVTRADGTYRVLVRPGRFLIEFGDWCAGDDAYVPELWDDVIDEADATEIEAANGDIVSGIDAALAPGCPGWASSGLNQVVGSAGDDVLPGTPDDDVICGLEGHDILNGEEGHDILLGGSGNDVLNGGPGHDVLWGDQGRDVLNGGPGRDWLIGGGGNDRMRGQGGGDTLFGGSGNDRLSGGSGNDFLHGGPQRDVCDGGPGRDRQRACEVKRRIP